MSFIPFTEKYQEENIWIWNLKRIRITGWTWNSLYFLTPIYLSIVEEYRTRLRKCSRTRPPGKTTSSIFNPTTIRFIVSTISCYDDLLNIQPCHNQVHCLNHIMLWRPPQYSTLPQSGSSSQPYHAMTTSSIFNPTTIRFIVSTISCWPPKYSTLPWPDP